SPRISAFHCFKFSANSFCNARERSLFVASYSFTTSVVVCSTRSINEAAININIIISPVMRSLKGIQWVWLFCSIVHSIHWPLRELLRAGGLLKVCNLLQIFQTRRPIACQGSLASHLILFAMLYQGPVHLL